MFFDRVRLKLVINLRQKAFGAPAELLFLLFRLLESLKFFNQKEFKLSRNPGSKFARKIFLGKDSAISA